MSDQNLPEGAFLTTLNGRRCTAVPRSDAAAAPTPTPEPAPEPPVASNDESDGGGEEDGGEDGSVEAPVVAGPEETSDAEETSGGEETPGAGEEEEATDGAAASTAISFPESESTSEAEGSSRAQTEEEDALEETQFPAEDTAPSEVPPPPPPPPLPVETSTEDVQQDPPASPSASSSSDSPQISQTSQTSLPSPEDSPTDTSTAPTTSPTEEDNADDQADEPAPTPTTPEDDDSPDATLAETPDTTPDATSTDLNGAAAENDPTPTPTGISSGSQSKPTTAVVAGSVAGGVALVSIIAFLLWFWRKRAISKRRSSLLTPLTIAPGKRRSSEKPYVIDRGSVGPTPSGEKFRAAVGANFRRLRSKVSGVGASADLGRAGEVTGRDRFRDWWERLAADVDFNWKLRNEGVGAPDPAAARDMREKNAAGGSQPDFLTLLGMDEEEVRREAARRHGGGNSGSGSSGEHFLGGLALNFDSSAGGGGREDPFSDANALTRDSAKPAPLAVSSTPANPFSDENAAGGPSSYVADVRRSRGRSSKGAGVPSLYRDSLQSEIDPRRPKFRSDPFDLERPSLLGGGQDLTMSPAVVGADAGVEGVGRPRRAHTREDSFTSKYSSGFSLGDWSDPGPDVGPAAARGGAGDRGSRGGGSVGKAL